MIRSRRMELGRTSNLLERSSYEDFVRKPEVNKSLLILGRDMRIILRLVRRKWIGRI
jgi:hypothetical protein